MPEFSATDFITRLGRSLIKEFEEARQATTSPLIGVAIETPVRRRLEQVLPRGVAVGSGCVIDSYGNCSRQQDVVLYERDICPVFSINDTPESTYYPCEGVMAVIEVKSSVSSITTTVQGGMCGDARSAARRLAWERLARSLLSCVSSSHRNNSSGPNRSRGSISRTTR